MKRVILSGATGALGMALIQKCMEEQTEVLVLCRKNSHRSYQIPNNPFVKKIYADLADFASLQNTTGKKWDVFYHLAWEGTTGESRNDTALQMKNAASTLDAVYLAQRFGCTAFLGAGSQAEYGRTEGTLNAMTPTHPETGYGIAKLAAGQMSRLLCRQLGMRHVWTRILSVYGPWDGKQSMVMTAIERFLKGERASFTAGEQQWDYLYSRDAADALYRLGQRGIDQKTYCLGSGQARPLKEYILKIRDAVAPTAVAGIGEVPYAKGQVMYLCADIEELQKDTGFVPRVSFEEGIRETVEFVKNGQRTWR